jgi:hypothetical protein
LAGLEESYILSGWRGTGLWLVNVAKLLISCLFVENTNIMIFITNLSAAMRIRGSHLAS